MLIIGIKAIRNHCKILAFDKPVAAKLIEECNRMRCLTWGGNHERETIDTPGLLRLHRERPWDRRTADKGDELAPLHSRGKSRRLGEQRCA
jgi:hypothetical protein